MEIPDTSSEVSVDPFTWFSARIVLRRLPFEKVPDDELFEESIILLRAGSEEEAWQRAERLGTEAGHEYENVYGEKVIWQFQEVLDVVQVLHEKVGDGTEVYYKFLRREELEQVRQMLQRKL